MTTTMQSRSRCRSRRWPWRRERRSERASSTASIHMHSIPGSEISNLLCCCCSVLGGGTLPKMNNIAAIFALCSRVLARRCPSPARLLHPLSPLLHSGGPGFRKQTQTARAEAPRSILVSQSIERHASNFNTTKKQTFFSYVISTILVGDCGDMMTSPTRALLCTTQGMFACFQHFLRTQSYTPQARGKFCSRASTGSSRSVIPYTTCRYCCILGVYNRAPFEGGPHIYEFENYQNLPPLLYRL